jgi:molybdate-binding protein/biotin operon repressor
LKLESNTAARPCQFIWLAACYTAWRFRKSLAVVKTVEPLHSFRKIRLLADPRRLEVLRLLMGAPSTLTQLGERLGQSPAWVRHHVKTLEDAGLVRTTGRVTEKYYEARAGALLLEELILPKSKTPVVVFAGSHDLALQAAADHLAKRQTLLTLFVGSLNGLAHLRQGLCQLAGTHLRDDVGKYNVAYVHHLFPEGGVELITLAHRTQGLMLAAGNPKSIVDLADLVRPGIRLVQRNAGSGTRVWFDREFARQNIGSALLHPSGGDVSTHTEAANLIRTGKADVALGLQAAARASGLDFLPLFEERYDLVVPHEKLRELAPLLDYIQTAEFRNSLHLLAGYDAAHSGEQILLQ